MANVLASVPELQKRTSSTLGNRAQTDSASCASRPVTAPRLKPPDAARTTASRMASLEWPKSPAVKSETKSTNSRPSTEVRVAARAELMAMGKGSAWRTERVMPPGRPARARSDACLERGFCSTNWAVRAASFCSRALGLRRWPPSLGVIVIGLRSLLNTLLGFLAPSEVNFSLRFASSLAAWGRNAVPRQPRIWSRRWTCRFTWLVRRARTTFASRHSARQIPGRSRWQGPVREAFLRKCRSNELVQSSWWGRGERINTHPVSDAHEQRQTETCSLSSGPTSLLLTLNKGPSSRTTQSA